MTEVDEAHLRASRRLRSGELVTVGDGAGGMRYCRVLVSQGRLTLAPFGAVLSTPAPRPRVEIGLPRLKGDRSVWAIQKMTEIGVDRIWLVECERQVAGWTAAGPTLLARLARVVREAAMQSRRLYLPELAGPVSLADWAGASQSEHRPAGCPALARPGGAPPSLERAFVVVGPEGDFSPAELGLGLDMVDLGPTLLRTETAAVAAAIHLVAIRHRLLSPACQPALI